MAVWFCDTFSLSHPCAQSCWNIILIICLLFLVVPRIQSYKFSPARCHESKMARSRRRNRQRTRREGDYSTYNSSHQHGTRGRNCHHVSKRNDWHQTHRAGRRNRNRARNQVDCRGQTFRVIQPYYQYHNPQYHAHQTQTQLQPVLYQNSYTPSGWASYQEYVQHPQGRVPH